jgi:hypothetical protein
LSCYRCGLTPNCSRAMERVGGRAVGREDHDASRRIR